MSHKGDKCVEICVAAQQCHVTASDFPALVSTLPLAVLQPTLTGVPYLIALRCRELDEAWQSAPAFSDFAERLPSSRVL